MVDFWWWSADLRVDSGFYFLHHWEIGDFPAVYVKRPPANPPAAGPTFGPRRRPVGPLVFLCLDHRSYVLFKHVVKAFAVVVRSSRRPAVTLFLSCGSRRHLLAFLCFLSSHTINSRFEPNMAKWMTPTSVAIILTDIWIQINPKIRIRIRIGSGCFKFWRRRRFALSITDKTSLISKTPLLVRAIPVFYRKWYQWYLLF